MSAVSILPDARVGATVFDDDTRLGLGTYSLKGDEGVETIEAAIDAGYRHLDTARLYENEEAVGEAVAASNVDREDLFVAT